MFPSDALLQPIMDERERNLQERLRGRRGVGPRQPAIRWRSGNRPLTTHNKDQGF
jgi:hypothetical protein